MMTHLRHRWESVALSNGDLLCATHGSLICGDGEHRYDVTSYRCDGKVFTTLMVYNTDGTCPSSFAHEFVSERPWGNAEMEAALIRFCESRDGGMRSDGSVRDNWGGFVRFVEEITDDQGNDIYGSPVVTAMRWIPFDMASHTVRAAEEGAMDTIGTVDDDDEEEEVETGEDGVDVMDTAGEGSDSDTALKEGGTIVTSEDTTVPANGWEIWLWNRSLDSGCGVPSLTVYSQRRITDRNEALALWEECKSSCPGTPRMLVRISDNCLTQIEDISAFTVSIGTGVGYGGKM